MLAIEAGISLGWRPYVGPGIEVIGVNHFGASAPGSVVMNEHGSDFDSTNVVDFPPLSAEYARDQGLLMWS
jgi:transketolase